MAGSVITVKVPKELKDKMKRIKMNWSEYVRWAISQKIKEQELREASEKLDQIRARAKPVPIDELLSWLREGRSR
jgi:post-segregation antitoxin (ccd killing protein)